MFVILGDGEGIAWSRILLGAAALDRGDRERALELLEDGFALSRQIGYREAVAWALDQLGVLARREGEAARAATLFRESLALHRDLGDRWRTASLLEELAGTEASLGRFERAATLFGAAKALRDALSDPVPPRERLELERGVEAAREGMDEDLFRAAWEAGRATSLERVYDHVLTEDAGPPKPASTIQVPTQGTGRPRGGGARARGRGPHRLRGREQALPEPPHRGPASEERLPQARRAVAGGGHPRRDRARNHLVSPR